MGTTAQKLQAILNSKAAIKTAIENKGVTVGDATLAQYAGKIGEIDTEIQEAPENDVNFYDYDGFRVASYTIAEAKALTQAQYNAILPPSHNGLTFQEWNWTLADIQSYDRQYADIGANYITTDGKTHIIITIDEDNANVKIAFKLNGTISVNWGDNSQTDSYTKTAAIYQSQACTHTYSQKGKYEIVIDYSGDYGYAITSDASSNLWYGFILNEIRLGNNYKGEQMSIGNLWHDCVISLPTSIDSFNWSSSCARQINIPRNENFVISLYQGFASSRFNISFPKKIKNVTNGYIFNASFIDRLVYPEVDTEGYTIQNYQFFGTKADIFSIPNVQFATQANGAFFNANVIRYIDVPQGWTPSQSMVLSTSTCWSADSIVKFFNKLGTTSTAITLTFGTTNLNKLTADQKAIATNKGYTLA